MDVGTVFFLVMGACLLVGVMLALAWVPNRQAVYLWWAAGFLSAGVGLAFIALRDQFASFPAMAYASLFLLAGLTLCWIGARTFDNRPISAWPLAIGVLGWTVMNMIPHVARSGATQVGVMSCLLAFYSIAIGAEFWRGRAEALASRAPLAILCFVNGGIHLATVLTMLAPQVGTGLASADLLQGILLVQPAFILVAGGLYGVGIGRDRVEESLRRVAETDSLTGVYTRGAFFDRGAELVEDARRTATPLALMLFDLDRFKQINDSMGHLAGDLVLKRFAETVARALRREDLVGRIGGEEFGMLIPGASLGTAYAVAERIRQEFADSRVESDSVLIPATVSVGISALSQYHMNLDQLLSLADRALYEAKRGGRNRVATSVLALAS